jgi:hypothetical protein
MGGVLIMSIRDQEYGASLDLCEPESHVVGPSAIARTLTA